MNKNSIIKTFALYAIGSLSVKGLSVVTLPLVMSMLHSTEYGMLALTYSFISIATAVLGLGLRQLFAIEYFHTTSIERHAMANDMIILYLLVATPLTTYALLNPTLINQLVFNNTATNLLIRLCILNCFAFFFVELFYQALRYRMHAKRLTTLQILYAAISTACSCILLYASNLGACSMLAGNLMGMILVCSIGTHAYLTAGCKKFINLQATIAKATYYLKLSLPFIPTVLCGWILASSDRFVLARYATLHDVGIYSVADTVAQMFQLLVLYPLSGAYLPHLFAQFAQHKNNLVVAEQRNKKIMYLSMAGIAAAATCGYVLCKPIAYAVLPVRYHEAVHYMLLLLYGQIFLLGSYFACALLQYQKKTVFLAASLAVPAVANIGANILLAPHYGIMGCVGATVACYAFYFAIVLAYNYYLLHNITSATLETRTAVIPARSLVSAANPATMPPAQTNHIPSTNTAQSYSERADTRS